MLSNLPTKPSKEAAALVRQRAAEQVQVNKLYYQGEVNQAEVELRNLAQARGSEFDHYGGPEWVLAQALAVVEVRAEVQAKPGDILLMAQDIAGVVLFYSTRMARKCIAVARVKPLMGWDEAFAYWREQAGKPKAVWVIDVTDLDEPVISGEIPPLDARSEPEGDI
jgi:hypothetical protein